MQLEPDLPETHAAVGYYYYYGHREYDHALREFKVAQENLPNDSAIAIAVGLVQRRKAAWNDSLANLKAEALQQGQLARDERSIAIDAVAGPPLAATLARVYTIVGEKDLAVRKLAPLLSAPFGLSAKELKYDPVGTL